MYTMFTMLLGEFADVYESAYAIDPGTTIMYFWAFYIFMYYLMLNMLLVRETCVHGHSNVTSLGCLRASFCIVSHCSCDTSTRDWTGSAASCNFAGDHSGLLP